MLRGDAPAGPTLISNRASRPMNPRLMVSPRMQPLDGDLLDRNALLTKIAAVRIFVVCRVELRQVVEGQRTEVHSLWIGLTDHHRKGDHLPSATLDEALQFG